jgi:hypothetical protein
MENRSDQDFSNSEKAGISGKAFGGGSPPILNGGITFKVSKNQAKKGKG